MYCRKCGTENPDDSNFCENCGERFSGTASPVPSQLDTAKPAPAARSRSTKKILLIFLGLGAILILALTLGVIIYQGRQGGPMVFVPAGEFIMGVSADVALQECQKFSDYCPDSEWFAVNTPEHRVYLDAYYIDKYEVTQGEYDECVRADRCKDNENHNGFTGTRQPVVGVTWEDANNYCKWAGKRLPTEAQWEKAARGTDGRMYPWGNEKASCELANLGDCIGKTLEVGSKPAGASPYGALDMAGNVEEWVADWYDNMYYRVSPKKNPTGPSSGTARVLRGGDCGHGPLGLLAYWRGPAVPVIGGPRLGFRCSGD